MTKAEAIAMLKRIQEPEAWEPQINQAAFEALDMAIEALSQESSEDVISRQAAIDVASGYCHPANIADELRKLPSAQPERIRGRWIEKPNVHGVAYCSLCDYELHTNDTNFCPNCGADMRGEQDG